MKRYIIYILSLVMMASCAAAGDEVSPQVEEALYHFYMGKTYLQEQKCYDAMEEFLLAGQLCGSTDKVVLKGQICYHKGLLYVNKMDYSNALEMFSSALEFYALAGNDVREHIMYAYEGMAEVYAINGNPQESVSLYRKASEMAAQMRSKMLFSPKDSVVDSKENLFNRQLME
ncbi:MAG: tetratricopeptide repeat protein, partial [Bacteroidales bacterium]|nr:tetratricopeptide repeat protein [Bacteroidales bacterium]